MRYHRYSQLLSHADLKFLPIGPQPTLKNSWRYFVSFCPTVVFSFQVSLRRACTTACAFIISILVEISKKSHNILAQNVNWVLRVTSLPSSIRGVFYFRNVLISFFSPIESSCICRIYLEGSLFLSRARFGQPFCVKLISNPQLSQ